MVISINTDSSSALGFAKGCGKTGRMRHIDVRASWVKQIRDRKICEFRKIEGINNLADGLTKILKRVAFQDWEQKIMSKLPEDILSDSESSEE